MQPRDSNSLLALPPLASPSEEAARYRALFDLAPHAQVWTDEAGRILKANRLAASLLGQSPGGLADRPLILFVSPPHRKRFQARFARLGTAAPPVLEEWEVRMKHSEGGVFEAAMAVVSLAEQPSGVSFLWALRDITPRKRTEGKLKERQRLQRSLNRQLLVQRDQLRSLSARYLQAREEETRRIAHQLHDEAAQLTTSAHLALEDLAREMPVEFKQPLLWVRDLVDGLEDRLRRLTHELRPILLDDLGLGAAVGFLAEGFTARTHVPVELDGDLGEEPLGPQVELTFYRVIQEALANAGRHAEARRVWIHLQRKRGVLYCSIRDDGVGFDTQAVRQVSSSGLGLVGMRERLEALGGRLEIRSVPGRGTELVARVPARRRR